MKSRICRPLTKDGERPVVTGHIDKSGNYSAVLAGRVLARPVDVEEPEGYSDGFFSDRA